MTTAEVQDARHIHRVPVRLAVSSKGRSAPLGVTRDLSLHGVFIETSQPLPVGTVVPLVFELQPREPLLMNAAVVRVTPQGMGLSFVGDHAPAMRRLRRYIVDRTSVQNTQRQVEQLHDAQRTVEPVRDPARIQALLERLRGSRERVLLIPADRLVRDEARVAAVSPDGLRLATSELATLVPGDEVHALTQLGYDAYSFELTVVDVVATRSGSLIEARLPTTVVYSERRGRDRTPASPGTVVRWPAPWDPNIAIERPVLDRNDGGLSFRAEDGDCLLVPGAPLQGATVVAPERPEPEVLPYAEVRHISRIVESPGEAWLRVGVAFSARSAKPVVEVLDTAPKKTRLGWLKRMVGKARTALSYGLHKSAPKILASLPDTMRLTIHGGPHALAALLDRTRDDERLRCPLVIVVPGFGGRKEQMSFFAGTVIDGFQRHHGDVAIVRIDGSNNIGESGKDPGCERDGMHALHYTVSGLIDDTLATLAWARKNPYVEPTHIILVAASMGSIGVRQVLARPDASDVGLWVSYMGAPDAVDSIRLVSGNIDLAAYDERGQKIGTASLAGLLTDGDRFWTDLKRLAAADLESAKRDMARIRADVVWLYGRRDAYMDPRRVHAVMTAPHPPDAARELVEVDGGHLPKTGEEAVAQFVRLTRRIWRHAFGSSIDAFEPSIGRLAARAASEWQRVRRAAPVDRSAWWKDYLLDPDGLGFDILELAEPYRRLMTRQAELLVPPDARAARVLDLGAGTGNLVGRLLERDVAKIVANDLVPEALAAIVTKVGGNPAVETQVVDVDGTPLSAMRRFIAGDLASARELAERIPGVQRPALEALIALESDAVHAALRGFDVDLPALARSARITRPELELLTDLAQIARVARGVTRAEDTRLAQIPSAALAGAARLPYSDASFDAVAMSLLLSYLDHPEDTLFEAFRILRPGGMLVVSSLIPDYDASSLYVAMIARFGVMPAAELPSGLTRDALIASARRFVGHAAELLRLAEEGLFKFYDPATLLALVRQRGFVDARAEPAFGDPPQAVIVTCRKP